MKKTHVKSKIMQAICGLLALAAVSLSCGCGAKDNETYAYSSPAYSEASESEQAASISFATSKSSFGRNKIVISDELLSEVVKLFDNKTFKPGDKADLSILGISESDNEGFETLMKALLSGEKDSWDKQTNIVTFQTETSFSISFDDEKISIEKKLMINNS